ncbi:hypothetical protein M1247_11980 [Mycobacterium sp. 21AC1]|uniref:hypothetical protein n=1 Tax=[Mycobacterium] appelbergii TaxID=2939269 RepID=UPI0029392E4F|nr:hypothetical protein [Mycobacterium sp. 21AC1]MDV3125635.1 hypothetical protein [Mycobacterium sp. 21AC1]
MSSRVQCGVTAGIALVGASVIAIAPIAPSTAVSARAVDAATALMASFEGMTQGQLVAESGKRFAEQFAQAPFIPLAIAMQILGGDNARLYSQIRQMVDSPVYVADPLIEAVANALPPSLGGGSDHEPTTSAGDGAFMQFRNRELLGVRDGVNAVVATMLGVSPTVLNENFAAELAHGVLESALRIVEGVVLAPVGLIPVAQAIVTNDRPALYTAIRQYTDAPLWAVDPAIEGLAKALPGSLGGGTDSDPTTQAPEDGALMTFRNKTLWGATRDTRVRIAGVLGVEVNSNGDLTNNTVTTNQEPINDTQKVALAPAVAPKSFTLDVSRLKPHLTKVAAPSAGTDDPGEAPKKPKPNLKDALKKAKAAIDQTVGKLTPKKKAEKTEKSEKTATNEDQPKGSDD